MVLFFSNIPIKNLLHKPDALQSSTRVLVILKSQNPVFLYSRIFAGNYTHKAFEIVQ